MSACIIKKRLSVCLGAEEMISRFSQYDNSFTFLFFNWASLNLFVVIKLFLINRSIPLETIASFKQTTFVRYIYTKHVQKPYSMKRKVPRKTIWKLFSLSKTIKKIFFYFKEKNIQTLKLKETFRKIFPKK